MNPRRRLFWIVFLAAAGLAAIGPGGFDAEQDGGVQVVARRPDRSVPRESAAVPGGPVAVRAARVGQGPIRDLFPAHDWRPPVPVLPSPPPAAPVTPTVVVAGPPPLPFRYLGKLRRSEGAQVFLAQGERLLTVVEGDVIDGLYRVERIDARSMELRYLPLDQTQSMPVGSSM